MKDLLEEFDEMEQQAVEEGAKIRELNRVLEVESDVMELENVVKTNWGEAII